MVAEGRGNSLDDVAMNSIMDLATGTDFTVVAMLMGDDGITRIKSISCLKD